MKNKSGLYFLRRFIFSFSIIILTIINTETAKTQQPDPFLITPYYGSFGTSQGYSQAHPARDFLLRYKQVLAADTLL